MFWTLSTQQPQQTAKDLPIANTIDMKVSNDDNNNGISAMPEDATSPLTPFSVLEEVKDVVQTLRRLESKTYQPSKVVDSSSENVEDRVS